MSGRKGEKGRANLPDASYNQPEATEEHADRGLG